MFLSKTAYLVLCLIREVNFINLLEEAYFLNNKVRAPGDVRLCVEPSNYIASVFYIQSYANYN